MSAKAKTVGVKNFQPTKLQHFFELTKNSAKKM